MTRWFGLVGGPLLALSAYWWLPQSYVGVDGRDVGLTSAGRGTMAVAIWMAVWWLTEAIHISATALLPIALFPLLGARTMKEATASYGHPLIFLFMGGFILALAIERWNLHRRVAFLLLRLVGTRMDLIVAGFMIATAGLSMWLSNTATTVMMLPVALSIIALVERERSPTGAKPATRQGNFAVCLMLGIAYAASIGGIGTIIGTPPNGILVAYLKDHLGKEIGFLEWMMIGVPVVIVFLPVVWFLLTWLIFPVRSQQVAGGEAVIRRGYSQLGAMSRGEWIVLAVFLGTAAAWLTRSHLLTKLTLGGTKLFSRLTDPGIAIIAALLLFVIPVDLKKGEFAMNWATAKTLPWETLVLFGGGLSLAAAVAANGVGEFIGSKVMVFAGAPPWLSIVFVIALVIFLTELTSNTATTATLVPVLAGIAPGLGLLPYQFIFPATLAASCAFMMPVATPPNAIVFGSGKVRMSEMIRAGLVLNVVGIVLLTALLYGVIMPVIGL